MKISKVLYSAGTLMLINFARKHQEKLVNCSIEEVAALASRVDLAIEELATAFSVRRPLAARWSKATQAKDLADDDMDNAVAELSYDLLSPRHLGGDRRHADYRALFPEGNIQFIDGPDRAEVAQVKAMVDYLRENPEHPMADRAEALATKVETLFAALEPVSAAESALRDAQATEREKRAALVRVLRKNVALIRAEMMDEKKVEALFPSIAESKVPEEEPLAAVV